MIYFAYGSNLDPGQMFERCPSHSTIGIARLPDHRLTFPRYSPVRHCATAGVEPSEGDNVWGVLYRIGEDDIPILHYHEGFDPFGPEDENRHVLEKVQVIRPGSRVAQTAETYMAVADDADALPSRAYMQLIIEGARFHGLPRSWITWLELVRVAG